MAIYPIRPISAAEFPAFQSVGIAAFNSNWPVDEALALERKTFEPERSLAAFDGEQMVGTALAFTFGLTVPGGCVAAAGISGVSVLPTYRRRGILSALMRRQLADVSAGNEPVAALFASESGIYRRYGYGVASEQYDFKIRAGQHRLADPVASRPIAAEARVAAEAVPAEAGVPESGALTFRLANPPEVLSELKRVYDIVRAGRPGMLTRSEQWWEAVVSDPPFLREGQSPLCCVIAADDAGARAYALYTGKPNWGDDSLPAHELTVRELFAVDPQARAALWHHLLSRDLVSDVVAWRRPIDDPLLHLLANRRDARPRASDGLWIRLIDLPAALTQRRYCGPVDVVIDVTDPLLPANSGRWRLRADGFAGAEPPTCERTSAQADVALGIADIGATYLGGTRLGTLAGAGLVTERRPGTLAPLSAALSWDPLPWSPRSF
jgi:predicted acetyltransferase